jgi:S-methylmethionine-dependent homocysteine/selenocysteine methylase
MAGVPTARGGESVASLLASLRGVPMPRALLFNCCAPQVVGAAVAQLRGPPAGVERLGGYANGFRTTTSEWLHERGAAAQGCSPARHRFACPTCADEYDGEGCITPDAYAAHAEAWVEQGATVVGGCCGVGPAHMRAVAGRLGVRADAAPTATV